MRSIVQSFVLLSSVVLMLVVMATGAPSKLNPKPQYNLDDAPALFEKFKKDYNRNYKDEADKKIHYEAFVKSLGTINRLNSSNNSATFDINKFADHTEEERKHMFGALPQREQQ